MEELTVLGRDIVFLNPEFFQFKWLLLSLFGVASLFFFWRLVAKPKATLGSKYPWLNSFAFWSIAVVVSGAIVVSLARPVTRDKVTIEKESIDVAFALDNSLSMRAADMGGGSNQLTRLTVAKREILTLMQEEVITKGDRAGLFVFGKNSVLPMPLTTDLGAFGNAVTNVVFSKASLENETVWGTNLPIAMEHVYEILDKQEKFEEDFGFEIGSDDRPVILFVLTDGDNETQNDEKFQEALTELQKRNVKVFSIGVGSREGATWTSLLRGFQVGEDYPPEYDEGWEGQVTRLETQTLSQISSATGGDMTTLTNGSQTAVPFMANAIENNRGTTATPVVEAENKMEYWYYVALGGILLLIVAILII